MGQVWDKWRRFTGWTRGESVGRLKEIWRRRPDLNRGWRFCRPLPYHLATAPFSLRESTRTAGQVGLPKINPSTFAASPLRWTTFAWLANRSPRKRAKVGAGNGIRTRDFDLGKVALYH